MKKSKFILKRTINFMFAFILIFSYIPIVNAQYITTFKEIASELDYDWIESFSEGLAKVKKNYKYGFINTSGKLIVPCEYDSCMEFSEGLAKVEKWGKYGFIDTTGKIVVPLEYDEVCSFREGLAAVKKNDKWFFLDKTGKVAIPFEYDTVYRVNGECLFSEGLAPVIIKNGNYCFIDKTGKVIIDCSEYTYVSNFSEGLAEVRKNGRNGFIDKTGKVVIPFDYMYAGSLFSGGLVSITIDGKNEGVIDKTGKVVIPFDLNPDPIYSWVYDVNKESDLITVSKCIGAAAYASGYMDKTGKWVVPFGVYDAYGAPFCEGLAIVKKDYEWGFIDTTGKVVIPLIYDGVESFNEGFARVRTGWGSDSKYGFIDKTGKIVVPLEYRSATSSVKGGLIAVQRNDKWSILQTTKSLAAIPITSKVTVNDKETNFDAYNINGSNYFKLRDIAFSLNDTEKQFNLTWDFKDNISIFTKNTAYVPVGGEMTDKSKETKIPHNALNKLRIEGKEVNFNIYVIDGNNYFKIQDIMKIIDVYVSYDSKTDTILIDTSKKYVN